MAATAGGWFDALRGTHDGLRAAGNNGKTRAVVVVRGLGRVLDWSPSGFRPDSPERDLSTMRCDICLKAGMSGNNVSHSNRHTKTRFKANVHKQTLLIKGRVQRVKICTRCLRTLNKPPRTKKGSIVG